MKLSPVLLAVMAVLSVAASRKQKPTMPTTTPTPTEDRIKQLEDMLQQQRDTLQQLSRQVMLQQFYMEEKIRSDGNSGVKSVRTVNEGTRNYYEPSHLGNRFCAIHDHANYNSTVGMGELMLVMNGVEFRTRHNDYKLKMPSPSENTYHATMDIPFPPVPESVLNKTTVEEQIAEMQEYFRAFKEQDTKIRDYKPYFKANLCYVEGAWTISKKAVDEPFESDRHAIDADSWMGLMEKVRFSSYSGSKSIQENYSFLPTNIMEVIDGVPHYAQWNYRIMCHPLKEDLPTRYFKQLDDLKYRFPNKIKMENTGVRSERFYINDKDIDRYTKGTGMMDKIMTQIPGKDNYGAFIKDANFGLDAKDLDGNDLNTAYYHRYLKSPDRGAMGEAIIHRGFSDANLWVAQTTHPQVAPLTVKSKHCKNNGKDQKACLSWTGRYTYALPLEVVYMTPLQSWNPYDIELKETNLEVQVGPNKTRRNGGQTVDTAYNGAYGKGLYYLTPTEFFSNGKVQKDKADTAKSGAGVLDRNGTVRSCDSSGIRIKTPEIGGGVGAIRLRYPIMQVHGEGSGVWKELNALKEMTMKMNRYGSLFEESPTRILTNSNDTTEDDGFIRMKTSVTVRNPPGEHYHEVMLTKEEADSIAKGERLIITTSEAAGHSHELVLRARAHSDRNAPFRIKFCDGRKGECWDGHSGSLYMSDD